MNNYKEIMERLKLYFEVSTYVKVAEKLDISYDTVKSWSSRKKVVIETLLEHLTDEPINITWLLTGKGTMRLSESEILLNDISKIESAFNSSIDPMLLNKIGESEKLQELIGLLEFSTDEFLEQVILRLKEFKNLSNI